jgi:hypothetical protein
MMSEGYKFLVTFESCGFVNIQHRATIVRYPYVQQIGLFLKGLPAIALAQARRAGDILEEFHPCRQWPNL